MPLLRYFMMVGSALVALLFAADAYFPKAVMSSSPDVDHSSIRISSAIKQPGPIVFDTNPAMVAAQASREPVRAAEVMPVPEPAIPAAAVVPSLDALAQMPPSTEPEKPQRRKRRIASRSIQRQAAVAQPQRLGAFDPWRF